MPTVNVTDYYTADISQISVGYFADAVGCLILMVGVEEIFNPETRQICKRYWVLNGRQNFDKYDVKQYYNFVLVTRDKWRFIDNISTNTVQLRLCSA